VGANQGGIGGFFEGGIGGATVGAVTRAWTLPKNSVKSK